MVEKMSNTDKSIIEAVNKVYRADVDSIRNLAAISKKLQAGKLTIPGNLTVEGDLTVNKNSTVKGQTTINSIYGGKSTGGGWRDIIVNGGHLRFVTGSNKFGIHSNENGLHFYKGNTSEKLPIWKGVHAKGNIEVDDYLSTRRLDVKNDKKKGTTHFNYNYKGDNYIRGNLQVDNSTVKINGNTKIQGKDALKRGDKVKIQSYGGWHHKQAGKHQSTHYGLHVSGSRKVVTWYGGDNFALE